VSIEESAPYLGISRGWTLSGIRDFSEEAPKGRALKHWGSLCDVLSVEWGKFQCGRNKKPKSFEHEGKGVVSVGPAVYHWRKRAEMA